MKLYTHTHSQNNEYFCIDSEILAAKAKQSTFEIN